MIKWFAEKYATSPPHRWRERERNETKRQHFPFYLGHQITFAEMLQALPVTLFEESMGIYHGKFTMGNVG